MSESLIRAIIVACLLPFWGFCCVLFYWLVRKIKARHAYNVNVYQEQTKRTANPETDLINCCFGLVGETGEVVDLVKKHLYQGHTMEGIQPRVKKELGDVMWYVCMTANLCGLQMNEVLEENMSKLRARYPEGFSVERSINRNTEEK